MRMTSSGVLCQAMSGWRRIVPVAVQGASSSTRPTGRGGRQSSASATSISASSSRRARFAAQALGPPVRQLDRGHPGAGRGQLRGLAAGRGAQVDHRAPARRRRAGAPAGRPPRPAPTRRPRRSPADPRSRRPPAGAPYCRTAARRRAARAQSSAIGLDREIERRLDQMRLGDRARDRLAVGRASSSATASPACSGGRRPGCARRSLPSRATRRSTALTRPLAKRVRAAGQRHGLGHGGMRRRVQEQQLRGAQAEQVVHADRLRARAHEPLEQSVDLAEPAQRGGHQQAGERPIARGRGAPAPGGRRTSRRAGAPRPAPGRARRARSGARSPGGPWSRAQAAGWSSRSPSSTRRISAVVSAGP